VGERGVYEGKKEVILLPGVRRSRGEYGGEICSIGVVQLLSYCSSEFGSRTATYW
jgi:hypothetical protein